MYYAKGKTIIKEAGSQGKVQKKTNTAGPWLMAALSSS